MSTTRVTWEGGGEGDVGEVDDLHVTVRASTRAFPPGAPARATLHAEEPMAFTLKVAGSRREGDGFVVRGRLINATVALKAAFVSAAQKPS